MGEAACGVDATMPLKVNLRYNRHGVPRHLVRFARSPIIASKFPGFYFSAPSQVAPMMSTLVTLPEFDYMLQTVREHAHRHLQEEEDEFPFNLKKRELLIRMRNGTNQQDRTEIVDLVSSLCDTDYIHITDTQKTIDGVVETTNLLSIFFSAVAILTMFLCFFISWISFRQNVNEHLSIWSAALHRNQQHQHCRSIRIRIDHDYHFLPGLGHHDRDHSIHHIDSAVSDIDREHI